jgi:hypothetical protein
VEQKGEQHALLVAAQAELKSLHQQLIDIEKRKAEIESKISAVSRTVETLNEVYGSSEDAEESAQGITDQIKYVFATRYPNWLTPVVVRKYAEMFGFQIKGDNPMAAVHQVIRRLVERGSIEMKENANAGKVYRRKAGDGRVGKIEESPSLSISSVGFGKGKSKE